ncbi:MAG: hypothetical protein F7C32_01100 [Desulfurococcales archaeon]|nr:hypothetical protein [Desulfurococcales archaeon]
MQQPRLRIVNLASKLQRSCRDKNCSWECIEAFIHENREHLKPYIDAHLDGKTHVLTSMLHKMFSRHPQLCKSMIELRNRLSTNTWETMLVNLSLLLKQPTHANLVLFYTGFDSALSAYGKNIYVGLEWFTDPGLLGLPEDSSLYDIIQYLYSSGWDFIITNLIHELVHIHTPPIRGDPTLARLLEEGRACLLSWLVNPHASLRTVIPLINHDIIEYEKCRDKLLQLLEKHILGETIVSPDKLFSPTSTDPICGLPMTGYYIGFLLNHHILLKKGTTQVTSISTVEKTIEDILSTIEMYLVLGSFS